MKTILHLYDGAKAKISAGIPISAVTKLGLFDKLNKMKYDIPNDRLEMFNDYIAEIDRRLLSVQ